MTDLSQQLEDKKKELLRLDKYIHKYRKAHCPICKEKMNCFEDIEKHKKLTKHFGDYAEDLNLNERKIFQLEEYNIRQAEIAILEQAISEIKNIQSQQQNDRKISLGETTLVDGMQTIVTQENISADISNLLQKQRQEILEQIGYKLFSEDEQKSNNVWYKKGWDDNASRINKELQQLNQPKTER